MKRIFFVAAIVSMMTLFSLLVIGYGNFGSMDGMHKRMIAGLSSDDSRFHDSMHEKMRSSPEIHQKMHQDMIEGLSPEEVDFHNEKHEKMKNIGFMHENAESKINDMACH